MFAFRRVLLAFPFVAALALAGCKVNSINYFPPHPAPVRVINLMTDSSALNVSVGGNVAYTNVAFQATTGYQSFDNQITNFAVTVPGAATPLLEFSVNLAGSQPYTLLLTGLTSNPAATLLAEFNSGSSNGNVQVTVFNGAINQGNVDVYVTAPGVDIASVNPSFFSVGFNGNSRNLAFPGGSYQIRVTPSGAKGILYDSGTQSLPGNAGVSIVLYSKGSGVLVNAAFLQAQGPAAIVDGAVSRLRAINVASQTGNVNQLLGGATVASNIGVLSGTSYNQVPPGAQTISFEATATPGATIASVVGTLGASADQSVFVTGLPGAQQAVVLNDLNLPPIAGNVRVRFVNAAPDAGAVTIQANGVDQVPALLAPNASPYFQLVGGTYTFTFIAAASGATLFTLANQSVPANQTFSVYLTGTAGSYAVLATQDN